MKLPGLRRRSKILCPALFMRRMHQPLQHHINQTEQNRAHERWSKTAHVKARREQRRRQFEHESVNYEPEETQRQQRERESDYL